MQLLKYAVQWLKAYFKPVASSARDLLPIVVVIAFFQIIVLQQTIPHIGEIIIGMVCVLFGLALFIRGLETGLFPIGESMAYAFAKKGSVPWLILFAFLLGFGTTVAEPALIIIADKAAHIAAQGAFIPDTADDIKNYAMGIRMSVAVSVGLAIVLGVIRILTGWPLPWFIIGGYILVVMMSFFAPREIIGIAYDAGGVTTSTITVPLVTALGVGLASSLRGRNPLMDGFGLIALASLLPVISVMLYGIWVVRG